ncbi:MAG: hypothetical protein PVI26_03635 [Chitinispirillia bacterium]
MNKLPVLLFIMGQFLYAQNISIAFLGILPGGTPEFEKSFEVDLRERLSVLPDISLTDYNDIEYLKKKTGFIKSPVISRNFIETIYYIADDKTLLIWGKVNNFTCKPVRKWLIGAEIEGTLSFSLILYSLYFKNYMYLGDVESSSRIKKPPVFFQQIDKSVHVDVIDRIKLFKMLEKDVSERTISVINGFIKSIMTKTGIITEENVEAREVPSISDMFEIPSIEPSDINRNTEEESETDIE